MLRAMLQMGTLGVRPLLLLRRPARGAVRERALPVVLLGWRERHVLRRRVRIRAGNAHGLRCPGLHRLRLLQRMLRGVLLLRILLPLRRWRPLRALPLLVPLCERAASDHVLPRV